MIHQRIESQPSMVVVVVVVGRKAQGGTQFSENPAALTYANAYKSSRSSLNSAAGLRN